MRGEGGSGMRGWGWGNDMTCQGGATTTRILRSPNTGNQESNAPMNSDVLAPAGDDGAHQTVTTHHYNHEGHSGIEYKKASARSAKRKEFQTSWRYHDAPGPRPPPSPTTTITTTTAITTAANHHHRHRPPPQPPSEPPPKK